MRYSLFPGRPRPETREAPDTNPELRQNSLAEELFKSSYQEMGSCYIGLCLCFLKRNRAGWWWHKPLIPALGTLEGRQETGRSL